VTVARPWLALSYAPPVPARPLSLGRSSDLPFVAVVLAGVAPALVDDVGAVAAAIGLVAVAAYVVIGLTWRRTSRAGLVAYFALQLALGTCAIAQFRGSSGLLLLPLVTQATFVLPRRGVAALIALLAAWVAGLVALLVDPRYVPQAAVGMVSACLFVAVFSELLVRELIARAENERLAAALRAANARLDELATARERNRIARDIHDGLGHSLTIAHVQLEAARATLAADPVRARAALDAAQGAVATGLADVRASVSALRAAPLAGRSLDAAIAALVDDAVGAGLPTELVVTGAPRRLPALAELALYRAAQELLTNVRKHARASRAAVTLGFDAARIRLRVSDDGRGGTPVGGVGLVAMRERLEPLGGRVDVRGELGFEVDIELPA
jgi:signal transduction histidine kinase